MVKKLPTKAEQSALMEQQMRQFLKHGGKVDQVPQGTSGKEPGDPPTYLARRLFTEPRESRTFVPEVVAAIEARRKEKLKRTPTRKRGRLPKPRRKTIYDDFGEPLRRVWVEED
jgi:hypothetical protein